MMQKINVFTGLIWQEKQFPFYATWYLICYVIILVTKIMKFSQPLIETNQN